MDRRSWLWRRKSTDKSSAETETTTASSASERFTDEQVSGFKEKSEERPFTSTSVSILAVGSKYAYRC